MKDLPNKLRIKASMIELGERIAWGSEAGLMKEAANKIEELEAELAAIMEQSTARVEHISRLEAEQAALKAQEPVATVTIQHFRQDPSMENLEFQLQAPLPQGTHKLYASPVSQQKVVMPDRMTVPMPIWKDARRPYGDPLNAVRIGEVAHFNLALDEVARLNSSPVSDSEPVPATIGLTEYTYREALKTLREVLDPDDWMGEISMHAFIDAALSAPNHGEPVANQLIKGMADALRHALKELDTETPEDIDYGQLYSALAAYEAFKVEPAHSDDARDALVVALDALIADYDGEIHNEYDGTSMLDSRLSEINYAREALAAYRAAQEKK